MTRLPETIVLTPMASPKPMGCIRALSSVVIHFVPSRPILISVSPDLRETRP